MPIVDGASVATQLSTLTLLADAQAGSSSNEYGQGLHLTITRLVQMLLAKLRSFQTDAKQRRNSAFSALI